MVLGYLDPQGFFQGPRGPYVGFPKSIPGMVIVLLLPECLRRKYVGPFPFGVGGAKTLPQAYLRVENIYTNTYVYIYIYVFTYL